MFKLMLLVVCVLFVVHKLRNQPIHGIRLSGYNQIFFCSYDNSQLEAYSSSLLLFLGVGSTGVLYTDVFLLCLRVLTASLKALHCALGFFPGFRRTIFVDRPFPFLFRRYNLF